MFMDWAGYVMKTTADSCNSVFTVYLLGIEVSAGDRIGRQRSKVPALRDPSF